MGYANPFPRTYVFDDINFATSTTAKFKGPKGLEGRVRDISVNGQVLFTAVTTPAYVRVGKADNSADAAYAEVPLGTLAAGGVIVATQDAPSTWRKTGAAGILPMNTEIKMSFVAPTGGTPAGTGDVTVTVDWF